MDLVRPPVSEGSVCTVDCASLFALRRKAANSLRVIERSSSASIPEESKPTNKCQMDGCEKEEKEVQVEERARERHYSGV